MGAGGVQLAGTPTLYTCMGTAEQQARTGFAMPIRCDIPEGTQLQVRATADSASPETHNVAIYGVR